MGAQFFITKPRKADNAQTAFDELVHQALGLYGSDGYTGTIAEKDSFVMIDLPEGADLYGYIEELCDTADERIDDKWGPAGCIKTDAGYTFFGWASN